MTVGPRGPETGLGLLGFLLNLPGMGVAAWLGMMNAAGASFAAIMSVVFIVQMVILTYATFVILRFRRRKAAQ